MTDDSQQKIIPSIKPDPPQSDSSEDESPPSASQQRKRQRLRWIALAVIGAVTFLAAAFGVSRFMRPEPELSATPDETTDILLEDVVREFKRDPKSKILRVENFEVNDAMIAQLAGLELIETLIVDEGVLSDDSIPIVAALPNLRQLRLRLSPIGDTGLKELTKCKTLWFLNLPHARCTAAGVGELSAIPTLRQLRLGSPHLGNDVTREIEKITTLRTIHLIGVPVTDEGLKVLAQMPQLESLYLDDSAVTDAGWDWLFKNRSSLHVHINQQHHDRDPQKHPHHE